MKKSCTVFAFALLALLTVVPVFAQATTVHSGNVTDGCVTDYDASVDYFPDKVEIVDADGFSVEYHNHYKVISVTNAFNDAPLFEYVLVQCGTPAPDAADFPVGTRFIDVPTGKVIAMSTTEIPHLAELGLLDNLVGMDTLDYVNNPDVRALIEAEELIAVGYGSAVNVEAVIDAEVDLVLTYGYNPATDAYPVLEQAGIFTALDSEYREATPLGRAEWIKFTAMFYNVEARANQVYDEIATEYQQARELAAHVPAEQRPTVLWDINSSRANGWRIPNRQSYIGSLIQDAGGEIALGDVAPPTGARIDFEVVYDGGLDADIWITTTQDVDTKADLLALDTRYADFAPFKNGSIWSNDLNIGATGGNNYWEVGVTNPNLLLQDLVAIFHPDLMPDHEFIFFRPIARQ